MKEILFATPFTVRISRRLIFAVPDQYAKNAKIMHLENLALYGNELVYIVHVHVYTCTLYMYMYVL